MEKRLTRIHLVLGLLLFGLLYGGCKNPFDHGSGVEGHLVLTSGGVGAYGSAYLLPLVRFNQPPYYSVTDGGGKFHLDALSEGWWVVAGAYQRGMAWSQPFYYYYDSEFDEGDELVKFDIIAPFNPIDGPVSAIDTAQGHMIVAANIPDGPSYTNGLFLITREGWNEFFPIFDDDNWEYGKPNYSRSTPGEVVFAAGRPGHKDIYRFQMFTGELYNLTNSQDVDENDPCFSPDGQEIVFTADALVDPYGYKEIWVMARDGSGRFTLMSDYIDIGGGVFEYHNFETPTWHNQNLVGIQWGSIAFSVKSESSSNNAIAVCSRDLQDVFWRLTSYSGENSLVPTIHPASTAGTGTIVYSKRYEAFPSVWETDLWNMTCQNIEGPGASLTEWALSGYDFSAYDEIYPAFNPTGSRLSFVSADGSIDEVYGASYTRNISSADGLSAMELWTTSASGDIYVGPTILGH